MLLKNPKFLLAIFVIIVIVLASAACAKKDKAHGQVIMPSAYQFCLENPKHEECVP